MLSFLPTKGIDLVAYRGSAADARCAGTFGYYYVSRRKRGEPPGRAPGPTHPDHGKLPMGKGFTTLHLGQVRVECGGCLIREGEEEGEGEAKKGG
jgi:hypothetical protein